MKIIDNGAPPPAFTLDDAQPGDVVRLESGKLYMVVEHTSKPTPTGFSSPRFRSRHLINLETGASWTIANGNRTKATRVDATLEVS